MSAGENSFPFESTTIGQNDHNLVRNMTDPQQIRRIPTIFHETFSLSRPCIGQVLAAIRNVPPEVPLTSKSRRQEYLRTTTNLGPNYIRSVPNYCKGAGLIDFEYRLARFGKAAVSGDSRLEQAGTQWLMHYHLSAPRGPGPLFWHELTSSFLFAANTFSTEDLVEAIDRCIWQTEGRTLARRAVQSTATIFLGTYLKPEGLNKLHLLEPIDGSRYRVCEPSPAPTWAIACAFVDFWGTHYANRLGVGLDTLLESGFPELFMIGKSRMVDVLEAMSEAGYVEMHRTAPPHQVLLLRGETEELFERLYSGS